MWGSKGNLSRLSLSWSLDQAIIYVAPSDTKYKEGFVKWSLLAVLYIHSQSNLQFPWKHDIVQV